MDQRFPAFLKKLFIVELDGGLVQPSPYKLSHFISHLDATWLI